MANYETLKAAIQAVIKTNGNQTITGAVMQSALISMISGLGANMQFAGIATPTTSPGTPDGPTFYLAFQNGTYFNFDKTYLLEKPKVFMWGRPGGPEGAWESVELGVPTMAKYNTDRQLEQNRVNTALAAKANSEDVNNEFTEVRSDLSQKSSMFTGAIMGKGVFRKSDAPSWWPSENYTVRVVFRTGANVSTDQWIFETAATNYALRVYIQVGKLQVLSNGIGAHAGISVTPQANTLYEAILVNTPTDCSVWLNTKKDTRQRAVTYRVPEYFLLGSNGGSSQSTSYFRGTIISAQLFNFPFSDEDAIASWNNGHPELWRVPDVLRYKSPTVWPTATYKSGSTFFRNDSSIVETDNIPSANGFSKDYQRFEQNPAVYCGFLNASTLNTKPFRWKFTIEYRADSSVTVEMKGGYSHPAFTLDANTGDAKTVQFVTDAGYGVALRARGGGTYLEVATISVESANIVCNLIPASLTPTVWKDISGQGNDIPYVPFDSNPNECEMAYENMGFPDTIIGTEAPVVAPNFIGQRYIDTTNKAAYTAYGTSSASDWK